MEVNVLAHNVDVARSQLLQASLDADIHTLGVVAGVVTVDSPRLGFDSVAGRELHLGQKTYTA